MSDGVGESAERAAYGNRELANLDGARVAESRRLEAGGADLDHREIVGYVGDDHLGHELARVIESDGQRGCARHNVIVCEDVAIRRHDDAGAEPALLLRPLRSLPLASALALPKGVIAVEPQGYRTSLALQLHAAAQLAEFAVKLRSPSVSAWSSASSRA